jgi:hypothetical protein
LHSVITYVWFINSFFNQNQFFMALPYYLVDNPMTPDPTDRRAVVQVGKSYTIADIIDQMISRGSTVTKAEALSVFEELGLAIENILKEGNSIKTDLFRITPTISGVFTSNEDSFDPERHEVRLRINPGLRLRETENKISVERTNGIRPQPTPIHFDDYGSETQDDLATAGKTGRITGSLLKFDENDPLQGVFFINIANGNVKQVTGRFVKNKPGELIFSNPSDLTTGVYRLEVRALLTGNKNLRAGSLPYELTVS